LSSQEVFQIKGKIHEIPECGPFELHNYIDITGIFLFAARKGSEDADPTHTKAGFDVIGMASDDILDFHSLSDNFKGAASLNGLLSMSHIPGSAVVGLCSGGDKHWRAAGTFSFINSSIFSGRAPPAHCRNSPAHEIDAPETSLSVPARARVLVGKRGCRKQYGPNFYRDQSILRAGRAFCLT